MPYEIEKKVLFAAYELYFTVGGHNKKGYYPK